MHLLLTDRMTCPRCGPDFGLILLAHEVRERRIYHGEFGCANCRDQFPVVDGFGDLRAPPRTPLPSPVGEAPAEGRVPAGDPEEAVKLAAFMGVSEGPGTLLLTGHAALHARAVSKLVPEVEIVALDAGLIGQVETEGVSRIVSRPGIPFFSGTFLGVTHAGTMARGQVMESLRVLAPMGRIAFLQASSGSREFLEDLGLRVLLDQEGVLVAQKSGGQLPKLITLRGP